MPIAVHAHARYWIGHMRNWNRGEKMPLTTDELQTLDSVRTLFSREEQAYETKQKDDAVSEEAYKQWKDLRLKQNREARAVSAKKREREGKVAQIRQNCGIQIPTEAFDKEFFATAHKENMGSKKRKLRARTWGSRLRKKQQNAEAVEESGKVWEQTVKSRMRGLEWQVSSCSDMDFHALSQFLTQDFFSNKSLLQGQLDDGQLSEEQIQACIRQYKELDFQVDLRTDETVAKDSLRLEELTGKTEAMKHLIDRHPEMTAGLSEEEKQDLLAKLDLGEQIADYYTIQKKVITNSWYRTHYNSEISFRYREEDSLQQKNLTLLLWYAEWMKNKEEFKGDRSGINMLEDYRAEIRPEEAQFEAQTRQLLSQTPVGNEFQKNDAHIEDSRHAAYFRQLNVKGTTTYERLTSTGNNVYYVVGEKDRMSEGLTRYLSNLPRLEAVRHMKREQVEEMVENLAMTPVHMSDPEEVEACRNANWAGMRMFKDLLYLQMEYVERKYGNGFLLLSPQEMLDHIPDFMSDFTNMQGMLKFIEYCEKLGMFDKDSPADQELKQRVEYYQNVTISEAGARERYNVQSNNYYRAYSDYKAGAVRNIMTNPRTRNLMLKTESTMHLSVRWGTYFDETDVLFDEVLKAVKYSPLDRGTEGIDREPYWSEMTRETRDMSREEALIYFIEKEAAIAEENQEFESEQMGRVLTAERMLQNIDKFRTESTISSRYLYDQMAEDMRAWLRQNRWY